MFTWGREDRPVVEASGSGVWTEIFRCMQRIGNILVLGGLTGVGIITYRDVTLFFFM